MGQIIEKTLQGIAAGALRAAERGTLCAAWLTHMIANPHEQRSYISDFRIDTPPYRKSQNDSLGWLAAEFARRNPATTALQFQNLLRRVGAKPPQVESRAHYLPDFATELQTQLIFKSNSVAQLDERMKFFDEAAASIFRRLLKNAQNFSELFHVTCTGYISPSAAQRWVVEAGSIQQTRVRHLYHMGCYAALPALHQAHASVQLGETIEICHTELCTLHLNPSSPSLEDMVVQTLFADGACAYRVSAVRPTTGGFYYVSGHEELISESGGAMSWGLSADRFTMVLSKDVPALVKKALPGVLERACGGIDLLHDPSVIWAIHPGGPKIIDEIQQAFGLSEDQVCYSRRVLKERGNMSSATLPHIWTEILKDSHVQAGTKVLTMAFGPGLTVSTAQLEVVR